jgi:putative peptidoglycan lipid II flippase
MVTTVARQSYKYAELRSTTLLLLLSTANIVGGFLLQWYTLTTLGAGVETDALFAGLALPQAVLAIMASSFMHVLVPLLSGEDDLRFRRSAWAFATLTLATFLVLGLVLGLLAPSWVPLVAPGLRGTARSLTIHLARVQLVAMVFTAMAGVLWAIHRARRNFIWAECAPLLGTLAAWPLLILGLPRWGIDAAAWVQVVRLGLHAGLLVPGLGAFPGLSGGLDSLGEVWHGLRTLMIGTIYYRTEPLVDRALSSLAPSGDLSLYYLCQQVSAAAMQVANNGLIAPLVPALAEDAKTHRWAAFGVRFRRGVVILLAAAAAGYLVLVLGGRSVIAMTSAPENALFSRAWWLVAGLAGVFVAGPVAESFRTAFYATGNTATPVRVDVSVFTVGLALKVVGFALFGIWGMALAASTQALLGLFWLRYVLSRYIGGLDRKQGNLLVSR